MSQNDQMDTISSRRQFLKGAAVATLASCTAGAGVAYYQQTQISASAPYAPTAVPTAPSVTIPGDDGALQTQLTQTWEKLAESEAENLRLRAELDAANRRVEQLEARATSAEEAHNVATEEILSTNDRLEVVKAELSSALENNIVLAGLVRLYEELEELDLSAPLSTGLNQLQAGWETLWEDVPTFSERVELVQSRLAQFDDDITLFENAREWVTGRIERLGRFQLNLETILEQTQEAVGPLLEMLWGWFESVLSWLPFRLGQNSQRVMETVAEIISDLPDSRVGLAGEVGLTLDRWFKPQAGDGQPVIRQALFDPLKLEMLPQANQILERATNTRAVFDEALVGQLSPLMTQRKQRESAIERYKQENEVALSELNQGL